MGPPSGAGSRNWLWPEITDSESAAAAGRDGAAAAFAIAGITAVFAVLAFFDVTNVIRGQINTLINFFPLTTLGTTQF